MAVDYKKYTEFVNAVTSSESKDYAAFDKRVSYCFCTYGTFQSITSGTCLEKII